MKLLLIESMGLKQSGPGKWLAEKHGIEIRQAWHNPHPNLDGDTGRIEIAELTDSVNRAGFPGGF